ERGCGSRARGDDCRRVGLRRDFEHFQRAAPPYCRWRCCDPVGLPMADPEKRLYEQVLVLRCQTGDATAFSRLVERYGPRLGYYLQDAFGRREGDEDAWQDVWFTVFRKVRQLADPGAFTTWLYRIARRRAHSVLRQRRPSCRPMEEAEQVADPSTEDPGFSP